MASPATPQLPPGHWDAVRDVAWSPNGRLLATASADGTVLIRDEEGAIHGRLLGHRGPVHRVAWDPKGERLATAGDDGTARVWDGKTGDEQVVLRGHAGQVWGLAWSQDGRLATASGDQTARIWDPDTGEPVRVIGDLGGWVMVVAWSPDGLLATGGDDGVVRIWNTETGELRRELKGHEGTVRGMAWSPDGRLATTGHDGFVIEWNTKTGAPLHRFHGPQGGIRGVAWSQDGQLATGDDYGNACIWDIKAGKPSKVIECPRSGIRSVSWAPDGRLAIGCEDGRTRFWDSKSGKTLQELQGYRGGIESVAWHKDGRLATAGNDGTIRIWNVDTGEPLQELGGYAKRIQGVAWSGDGRLAIAGDDGTIRIWNPDTGETVKKIEGHNRIQGLAWSEDGRLATAGDGGVVQVWDPETATQLQEFKGRHGWVRGVAWSPDGCLATNGNDGATRIWDPDTGELIQELKGHRGRAFGASWSRDERLATTGEDGTTRIWDSETGKQLYELGGHQGWAWGVAWSHDERIATTGDDGTTRIWDAESGSELQQLTGHWGRVWGVAWSPDGRIATAGGDGTTRIWNLQDRTCLVLLPAWGMGGFDGTEAPFWTRFDGEASNPIQKGEKPVLETDGEEPDRIAPPPGATQDRPVGDPEDDLLDYQDYATALYHLVANETSGRPLTIAVNAPWGTGKSSIARLMTRRLEDDGYPLCWFNAWMHDDERALTPAFVRAVARAAESRLPWWRRLLRPLPRHLWDPHDAGRHLGLWTLRLLLMLVPLAVLTWTFLLAVGLEAWAWKWSATAVGSVGLTVVVSILAKTWKRLRAYVQDPQASEKAGDIPNVRRDMERLVDAATGTPYPWHLPGPPVEKGVGLERRGPSQGRYPGLFPRVTFTVLLVALGLALAAPPTWFAATLWLSWLGAALVAVDAVGFQLARTQERPERERHPIVVLVDDLERCRPPQAIDVLEAIEQLFTSSNVVVVLLADMSMVAANVQVKYEALAKLHQVHGVLGMDERQASRIFGRHYVQKMVQVQLDVPRVAKPPIQALLAHHLDRVVPPFPSKEEASVSPEGPPNEQAEVVAGEAWLAERGENGDDTSERENHSNSKGRHLTLELGEGIGVKDQVQAALKGGDHEQVERLRKAARAQDKTTDGAERHHLREVEAAVESAGLKAVEDPLLLRRAAEAAQGWLPGVPRAAKRILSRIRLNLYLCAVRGLLGGQDAVTPEDIGRWAAMSERWPELAKALHQWPGTAVRMTDEQAIQGALRVELGHLAPDYCDDETLVAFWSSMWASDLARRLPRMVAFHLDPGEEFHAHAPEPVPAKVAVPLEANAG